MDWPALVEGAETAFAGSPLWFDTHLFSVTGLEALGEKHEAAAETIQTELAVLVRRLPGLTSLQFAGGVPFASPETQKWVNSEVQSRLGHPGGSGSPSGDHTPEGLTEAVDLARQMAARGKLNDAVRRMQEGIAATGGHRARFLWRLELARLCLDSGRVVLAAPLLEELEGVIERHNLEDWEPELCKSVFTALLGARRALLKDARKATPELVQKTNQLHDRLSRLDPMAVLSLDGK
jgi:type VI secretion system protein VasJ